MNAMLSILEKLEFLIDICMGLPGLGFGSAVYYKYVARQRNNDKAILALALCLNGTFQLLGAIIFSILPWGPLLIRYTLGGLLGGLIGGLVEIEVGKRIKSEAIKRSLKNVQIGLLANCVFSGISSMFYVVGQGIGGFVFGYTALKGLLRGILVWLFAKVTSFAGATSFQKFYWDRSRFAKKLPKEKKDE